VDIWRRGTLKSLFVPGGVLFALAALALQGGLVTISAPAIDFYYYAVFAAGILLAWRFRSSRILLAMITLLLAHRAIEFFSSGRVVRSGPGQIALEAVALLLPLNFVVFSLVVERGLSVPALVPRLGLVFFESVFVAVICRPGETVSPMLLRAALLNSNLFHWTRIPQPALLAFVVGFGVLLGRFVFFHRPVESGLVWSLAAAALGLQAGGMGRLGSAYFATAGLILVSSIVENSYFLAYHDELTALPGRRAFNEALLALETPYAVAVVDIDHFKTFNDTYGHDTGDQVLRMVAGRLSRVTGGGRAYRVGGEEFSILFPEKSVKEVMPDLELLRSAIEESKFRVRGVPERRTVPRGSDRRTQKKKDKVRRKAADPRQGQLQFAEHEMSVTVSIGVAESSPKIPEVEQVIQAADKALYRAKDGGRNRVEAASVARVRSPRVKRGIA
jgi:diguanylate cyclase (GGDEF)-like protein